MTVFIEPYNIEFVIISSMKHPSQDVNNQSLNSDNIVSELQDLLSKKSDVIVEQQRRIKILEEYLRLAKSKRFGSSSEQTGSEQGNLFNEAEVLSEPEQEELPLNKDSGSNLKTGRKPFAKNLPRYQVFAYLSDEEKLGAINTFFVKVREELDIIPAKVQILEYMQEKAVFMTVDNELLSNLVYGSSNSAL